MDNTVEETQDNNAIKQMRERIKELEEFIESLQLSVGDDLRRFDLMGK